MSSRPTCNSFAHYDRVQRSQAFCLAKLPRHSFGMTLIEVLTSLALFALLASLLLLAIRLAEHASGSVARLNQGAWRVVLAQQLLRRVLESAYPFEPGSSAAAHGIDGTGSTLAVTGPMPMAAGSMGYYRYLFILQKRADGLDNLVVQTRLDRGSTSSPLTPADSAALPKEVLLARIESARWSYLAPRTDNLDASWQPTWLNSWHRSVLPLLIRLRVTFAPMDSRVWPELLVYPRITDNAQCQFDAIAQVCRRLNP